MALDVAEFLWNKFLKSLADLEADLSGSITIPIFKSIKDLMSVFREIKMVVKERDIMPEQYKYSKTIDVLYELNDAMAECQIFAHECKDLNKKFSQLDFRRAYFVNSMKTKLGGIKENLESLAVEKERIGNSAGETENEQSNPKTRVQEEENSNPLEKIGPKISSIVYGFDVQANDIVKLLPGGTTFTAIGVVGMAGAGKTTLVRKVLESQKVKDKFDPILWLPFSGLGVQFPGEQQYSRFSFETCIFDGSGSVIHRSVVGLDTLLQRLKQLLEGKKYLIVLDDVCHQHINIEERLCDGLPKESGGAVIITTRLKHVTRKLVEQKNLIHVKPLSREDCWNIFKNDTEFSNISYESEKEIEEIKDQCHGLPMVAKTLAKVIPKRLNQRSTSLP